MSTFWSKTRLIILPLISLVGLIEIALVIRRVVMQLESRYYKPKPSTSRQGFGLEGISGI